MCFVRFNACIIYIYARLVECCVACRPTGPTDDRTSRKHTHDGTDGARLHAYVRDSSHVYTTTTTTTDTRERSVREIALCGPVRTEAENKLKSMCLLSVSISCVHDDTRPQQQKAANRRRCAAKTSAAVHVIWCMLLRSAQRHAVKAHPKACAL